MARFRPLAPAFLLVLFTLPASAQSLFTFSCGEDDHVNAAKRQTMDSAALAFAGSLLGPNPSAAYDAFSKVGQQYTTRDRIAADGQTFVRQFEPKNVVVQHTYLINLSGKSPGRAICGTDFTKPNGWESLGATDAPEQGHVLISADVPNGHLAIAVWLVPEVNDWKVQSFWLNLSTLGDKDSTQLWALANAQKTVGHNFNAALLYSAALQTANRGPNFQMGITQHITEDMSDLIPPDEIKGKAPFLWNSADTTFKVLNVSPVAIGGKFYVIVLHEVAPWETDGQAEAWNKKVLSYFKQRFPEYSDVFAGIVVRAKEQGSSRLYGTVEETRSPK
jgi:hypothetical protein